MLVSYVEKIIVLMGKQKVNFLMFSYCRCDNDSICV